MDDNDQNEMVSVLMIMMKMSQDNGRTTGMTTGVWLNPLALNPRLQPGCPRSTAVEREGALSGKKEINDGRGEANMQGQQKSLTSNLKGMLKYRPMLNNLFVATRADHKVLV